MLCSDYDTKTSDNAFYLVKRMAEHYDAEVRISHVKTDEKPPRQDHVLESKREGHYFEPEVRYSYKLIRRSDVVDGINYYIDLKGDNDMLVVLSREHGLLERMFKPSHTHKLAYHTSLPLLILKD
jgi:nucleotide-binding universal stress UspA family protein